MRGRLQNSTYSVTVEGECEKQYFEHLKKLINAEFNRKRNCVYKPDISKRNPLSTAKAYAHIRTSFFHIQDVEDYNDTNLRKKFENLLKDIKSANKYVDYKLGYTNYSFELWICLHKIDMNKHLNHRDNYVDYVNKAFNKKYCSCSEYKTEKEFSKILSQITLSDVRNAITRAERIKTKKEEKDKISLFKVEFYKDNPDLSIHEIVKMILEDCLL